MTLFLSRLNLCEGYVDPVYNNVEDNVVFLARKVFNSNKFFIVSQTPLVEKPLMKVVSFQKQKHGYIIHT